MDSGNRMVDVAIIGLFILACLFALSVGSEFFIPLTLAILLHLVLQPLIRILQGLGLMPALASGLVVLTIIGILVGGASYLLTPVDQWIRDMPRVIYDLQHKISALREPVETVMQATEDVEKMTEGNKEGKVEVVLSDGSFVQQLLAEIPSVAFQAISMVFLLFFLLAYSGEILDRAVELLRTSRDKRELRELLGTIERVLSRYLATITLINAALGVSIAGAMYAIGMPTFYLWGVMAAVLNFIPYLGSVIGMVIVAMVALVTFDSPLYALLAPLAYLVCTTLEGQFITPAVLGRSISLNPIFIFVGVAFWAWLWGPLGALMAVPILIVIKAIASNVEAMKPYAHVIGRDRLDDTGKR